jgi:hypothetical protein
MNVTLGAGRTFRLVWAVLLLVWCGLAVVWGVRLLSGSGNGVSNAGSLALAGGSAFLALAHLDRNSQRQRAWMLLAILLIAVSLIVLLRL